jgi:membrane peptidoglycan carboxypeptidase
MANSQRPRRRPVKNNTEFTTKSGNKLRLNRSFSDRRRARKDSRARQRAAYLSTLPKERWKRWAYRLHPRRLAKYWFSREGGIMALKIAGVSIVVLFLILVGVFAYFRKDLPDIKDVSKSNQGGSISYYDRTGKTLLWQDYNAVKRIPVNSGQISKQLKQATIAIEDQHFYHEGAFNVHAIFRAAAHDVFGYGSGDGLQGGSTITMQLVKLNQKWTGKRTIGIKIKELILAVELERNYSKQEILTGYLNSAPYGGIEYGCEAAARDYFHTDCSHLTLAQASFMAAIPRSPSYYSPYSNLFSKKNFIERQHYVLAQMHKLGMITKKQEKKAKNVDILKQVHPLQPKYHGIKAPYFVLAAKHELQNKFGSKTINRGGWRVTTTLNMNLQKLAEQQVQNNLPNVKAYGGDEEALVAEDVHTGQIVALVGGVDFSNPDYGKINYAQEEIPPGSSFKPYDYASFINSSKNVGAGSVLYDNRATLPGYPCTNHKRPEDGGNCLEDYDFRFPGPETIRYALAGSRNVPAVKAMLSAGVQKTIGLADKMMGDPHGYQCFSDTQLTKPTKCYGSSALGSGAFLHLDEHVNGLATFARLGKFIPRSYILKITDSKGNTIHKWHKDKGKQILKKDTAYILDNMLSDPKASYLPGHCTKSTCTTLAQGGYKFQHYNGWKFAVKTGTTPNNRDGLMTSWSTKYAVVSWVGYHTRNRSLRAGGMEYLTEPLTRGFIEKATDMLHTQPVNWQEPHNIVHAPAFVIRNHVGLGSREPSSDTDIYPSGYDPNHDGQTSATIDKVSGKLATKCTPDLAKETINNSNASQFSVDKFVDKGGYSTGKYDTNASDDIHHCSDQHPNISLTVNENGQNSDQCNGSCQIVATVSQGTYPLSSDDFPGKVELSIDGHQVKSFTINSTSSPQSFSYHYNPDKNGQVTIKAQVVDSVLYQATTTTSIQAQQKSGDNKHKHKKHHQCNPGDNGFPFCPPNDHGSPQQNPGDDKHNDNNG